MSGWKRLGRKRAVRTRHVRQVEEADCGAACLAAVLSWFGRHVVWEELQRECGGGRDGLTAAALGRAAKHYGLAGRGIRVRLSGDDPSDIRAMQTLSAPAILFVDGNHFVVLDEVTNDGSFVLNDPACGRCRITLAEFRRRFSGIALTFTCTADFVPGGERDTVIGEVVAWARSRRGLVAGAVVAGTVSSGLTVGATLLMRAAVMKLELSDLSAARRLMVMMVGATVGVLFASWLQQRLQSAVLRGLSAERSRSLMRTLLHLPSAFFDRRFIGGVAARVQISDTIANQLTGTVVPVLVGGTGMAILFTVLLMLAPTAALLAGLGAAWSLILLRRGTTEESYRQGRLLAEQSVRDGEMISGLNMIDTLKAEGSVRRLLDRWGQAHARGTVLAHASMVSAQRLMAWATAADSAVSVAVVIWGGLAVSRGELSLPDLISVVTLVGAFQAASGTTARSGLAAGSLQSSFSSYRDVVDAAAAPGGSERTAGCDRSRYASSTGSHAPGRLEISAVEFGYDTNRPPLLTALSVRLEPGQRLIVVGQTGSGKSTVARLVAGCVRPWGGEIVLDGRPLDSYPPGTIGYVSQHPALFEGTVAENVRFGGADVDEVMIAEALATACLDEVVARRGGAWGAKVEANGQNFSGGERQRLALARALCRRPSVLILDEAMSAVEGPLEARIDMNLRRTGVTTLMIAHRLDCAGPDDLILVLDSGCAVQLDTHSRLATRPGHYRQLLGAAR
ncbi:ATP-binding cassette domain-containing protein [Streptomyces sp. NPDC048419]|uniref:ATP-binding cassette domain-containing protein n=1 Tax=Streptomyces sp. NPDC048419 TaxID=3365547 RepID=UPI0037168E26